MPKPVIFASVCGQLPISSLCCPGRGGQGISSDQHHTVSSHSARGAWSRQQVGAELQPGGAAAQTLPRAQEGCSFPAPLSLPHPHIPRAGGSSPRDSHPALPWQLMAAPGCRRTVLSCNLREAINQSTNQSLQLNSLAWAIQLLLQAGLALGRQTGVAQPGECVHR